MGDNAPSEVLKSDSVGNTEKIPFSVHMLAMGVILCVWGWIYWPFLYSLPAGVDFGAHLFRLTFFSENGLNSEWNGLWYTGTAFLEVYPPNTTFFLWLISIFFSLNQSYVIFLVLTHLLISIGVYWIGIATNRSLYNSVLVSLFIMTLPSLNVNFMFFSRAPTHIGVALFCFCLALYYAEKRWTSIGLACMLSLTHFMMFGFFIRKTKPVDNTIIQSILKKSGLRILIWGIPFLWVIILMSTFFSEPIGLIMLSQSSFAQFSDGPGIIYGSLRVLRSFIDHYITRTVLMYLILFTFSLTIRQLNWKEGGVILAGVAITLTGFLLFYIESNELLPLFLRGMDVLRFVLVSQILIILMTIRGITRKSGLIIMILVLLLPLAEAQNGISNYGYQNFDDNDWNIITPLAEELKEREGFYYACPYNYQGDFLAILPALTAKPYFDGWNPPGCRLSWFRDSPPSINKYRPNATLIQDVVNNPNKYGVKWMITQQGYFGLPGTWQYVSSNSSHPKWLYESTLPISMVDVTPFGNGSMNYLSTNKIQISIDTNESNVDLLIKVAHHPKWVIQENPELTIIRESEIGFMQIENVSSNEVILVFRSNQIDILFASFIVNFAVIGISIMYEFAILEKIKKFSANRSYKQTSSE
jgi:hypothetical protein